MPAPLRPRVSAAAGVCAVVAAVATAAAGCSGGGTANVRTLLADAKHNLDATSAVHFTLSSSHLPQSGTVLVGGDGDAVRPNRFSGTLLVRRGLVVRVGVVSIAGTVWIKAPFSTRYVTADPHTFGFSDPGALLDPSTGLTSLLTAVTGAHSAGHDRYHGEALDEVAVTLPGTAVKRVLTSADPAASVTGRVGISHGSHQLRRAVLTGPFLEKGLASTFTIVLDHYGEHVTISAPG